MESHHVGVPPWHLWGLEQTVVLPPSGATTQQSQSPQLARINYKRPDTWTFFFTATLISAVPTGPTSAVFIAFDLTLGVGRQSTTIPGFRQFTIAWTAAPPLGQPFFASTAPNVISAGTVNPTTDGFVETFPAQDIQCAARVVIPAANQGVTVSVGAYFAPRSHVRPDWYGATGDPLFTGAERGGR